MYAKHMLKKTHLLPAVLALLSVTAQAQTPPRRAVVVAAGQGTVSVQPDEAKVQFSVVTQAVTAQDAASQNATQVTAALAALRSVLGPNANLKTLSYSLNPNYSNGSQPILIGYTATNTVQVTLSDLSLIGKVIDTGIQAGANRVQGLQFGLQDDQPSRAQALKLATAQAKANADAMASGLGQHTGAAIAIQQGGTSIPTPVLLGVAATPSATTPVETGVVNVQASVTLDVALVP